MTKRGLNPEVITDGAVALLDEVGLAELSTRRLAAKLGPYDATAISRVSNPPDPRVQQPGPASSTNAANPHSQVR